MSLLFDVSNSTVNLTQMGEYCMQILLLLRLLGNKQLLKNLQFQPLLSWTQKSKPRDWERLGLQYEGIREGSSNQMVLSRVCNLFSSCLLPGPREDIFPLPPKEFWELGGKDFCGLSILYIFFSLLLSPKPISIGQGEANMFISKP